MPVVRSETGAEAEERNRFEQHVSCAKTSDGSVIPPGNPYQYREWPRMLYMARTGEHDETCGKAGCWAPDLHNGQYFVIHPRHEAWSRGSYTIAQTEHEYERLYAQGWRKTQAEAMAYAHRFERVISDAAAERAYADRNMSPAAKAEAAQVEAESATHVAEIPVAPVKRRGMPKGGWPKKEKVVI
jgi:hypothetical protein